MLIVLTFAVFLKEQRTDQVNSLTQESDANSLCELLSTSIDQVYANGKGSGMLLDLPQQINFKNYTTRVSSDKTIIISSENHDIFCSFKAEVSDGISNSFEIQKNQISISNLGEVVLVS